MSGLETRRFAALIVVIALLAGVQASHAQGLFSPGSSQAPKKGPAPSAEAQNKTLELIREVYKKEYEEAKTPAQKEALAEELLKRGADSKDPTERFVLLRVARDLAALVGELDLACRAIDELGRHYEVNAAAMKREALAKAEKGATQPKHFKAIGQQAANLVEDAILADDYDTARQMVQTALAAAKKARDGDLLDRVTDRAAEIDEIAEAKDAVKEALATLDKSPADPKANLAAGRFYCFYRGDWDKGLAMLALGADGTYDALAKQELVGAKTPEAQIALADGWWALVEKHQGMAQSQIRSRAALWYEKALPQLFGLTQMRVKKRLDEVDAAESPLPERPSVKPGETQPKVAGPVKNKPGFAGKWQDSFGSVIDFKVEGRNVLGLYKNYRRYSDGDSYLRYEGRITGTLSRDGRTLTAQWARTSVYYDEVAYSGTLVFKLARNGNAFAGTYRQGDAAAGGVWSGMRVVERPADGGKPDPKGKPSGKPESGGFEPGFGPRPGEEAPAEPKPESPRRGKTKE